MRARNQPDFLEGAIKCFQMKNVLIHSYVHKVSKSMMKVTAMKKTTLLFLTLSLAFGVFADVRAMEAAGRETPIPVCTIMDTSEREALINTCERISLQTRDLREHLSFVLTTDSAFSSDQQASAKKEQLIYLLMSILEGAIEIKHQLSGEICADFPQILNRFVSRVRGMADFGFRLVMDYQLDTERSSVQRTGINLLDSLVPVEKAWDRITHSLHLLHLSTKISPRTWLVRLRGAQECRRKALMDYQALLEANKYSGLLLFSEACAKEHEEATGEVINPLCIEALASLEKTGTLDSEFRARLAEPQEAQSFKQFLHILAAWFIDHYERSCDALEVRRLRWKQRRDFGAQLKGVGFERTKDDILRLRKLEAAVEFYDNEQRQASVRLGRI